jgi:NAD(P) transhydrogenase subunit alpha
MAICIGTPKETAQGEARVAMIPEVAKKFQGLGAVIVMEKGAGDRAFLPAASYAGVTWVDSSAALSNQSQVVVRVRAPSLNEVAEMTEGSILVGSLQPYQNKALIEALNQKKITSFALELIPRISRAQSMDVLSSQASVSGYQCVLLAASHCPKFFPMLTTAAGTIRPAKVLVIGAGVAGLQAIASARRLGAMVEAYDVRSAAKEQVESLGAKFVDTGVKADGVGGYARELTEEEKAKQQEKLAKAVAAADVVIATAAIPGRAAPRIISKAMVESMKPGAVIVDMAADSGGNCELTQADAIIAHQQVTLIGTINLPSRQPLHASEMYSRNVYNFLSPFIVDGELKVDWEDEVIKGSLLTKSGELVHPGVKAVMQ